MPAPIHPARGRLVGRKCAGPPARPSGALSGPRACLCPDPALVPDWQSCDQDIPAVRGLSPGHRVGEWVLEGLWAPGPHRPCHSAAGPCGCRSLSVGPEPFHLEGGLCRVQLWARLHPLAVWQKRSQTQPGFPTLEGQQPGSWFMENGKSGPESSKLQPRGKFPRECVFVFLVPRRGGPVCAGLSSRPEQTPPNPETELGTREECLRLLLFWDPTAVAPGGFGAAETGTRSRDN